MRCNSKGKDIILQWRERPVNYMCSLQKGHNGNHIAIAMNEVIGEWENGT